MCGMAGIIDLSGQRSAPEGVVQRMSRALTHRGPDEEGFLERPGISLASRRLSIVGLADGQQPMTNEDEEFIRGLQRRAVRLRRAAGRARANVAIAS